MERQRDEGLEAVGLVLQLAQLEQVVDAVFVVLDVAVEHGGVRLEADLVRGARGVEPLVAVNLVIADDVADAVGKDLGAAAGQRIHADAFSCSSVSRIESLARLREVGNLHHREGFQVHLREALLQARAQIQEILKWKIGMQSADDVEFGDGLGVSGGCGLESFFQRHGVGAGRVFLAAEGAQTAGGHADVGRIDVAVDVEVGLVAVHAFAHVVGQPADGEDVAGAVEREGVLLAEAFAGQHFLLDGVQARVVGLERVQGHAVSMINETRSRLLALGIWSVNGVDEARRYTTWQT